jgi:hypothetical protein
MSIGMLTEGMWGGLGGDGETVYVSGIFFETPIDGFFQNELAFFGDHENELIRDGYHQIDETPIDSSFEDESAYYGDHELESEYEGYYNE